MNIEERGDINIQTDHNVFILNYGSSRDDKINVTEGKGKSAYKWIFKDVIFDEFQEDLAELDYLYPVTNDNLINNNNTNSSNFF